MTLRSKIQFHKNTMANISIRSVSKTYDQNQVLHDVSVDIADGEFVALVGPSGCGKSTLLRMIVGLETITSGEIRINDRRINEVEPKDRNIAMVFQSYALYPHMTVAENMAFSLSLTKATLREINDKVDQAADILGLKDLLQRYPRHLSGGQRQRVAMGRAIVRDPTVFLFDEPLSNLDANLRVRMRTEIRELHQRLKTTTVFVTHDQVEAMTMADRIVVMHDGVVQQYGAPLDVYDRPSNRFVAGFIGSPAMNFLAGAYEPTIPNSVRMADGALLPITNTKGPLSAQEVVYGIRPEHVRLAAQGLSAQVVVVEPTGSETHVLARLGMQDVLLLVRDRVRLRSGDTIQLAFDAEQSHLFNPSTGLRL
jgi:multiple sugar transport system ATP-binding protein